MLRTERSMPISWEQNFETERGGASRKIWGEEVKRTRRLRVRSFELNGNRHLKNKGIKQDHRCSNAENKPETPPEDGPEQ